MERFKKFSIRYYSTAVRNGEPPYHMRKHHALGFDKVTVRSM